MYWELGVPWYMAVTTQRSRMLQWSTVGVKVDCSLRHAPRGAVKTGGGARVGATDGAPNGRAKGRPKGGRSGPRRQSRTHDAEQGRGRGPPLNPHAGPGVMIWSLRRPSLGVGGGQRCIGREGGTPEGTLGYCTGA